MGLGDDLMITGIVEHEHTKHPDKQIVIGDLKKNLVLSQDLEPILENSLNYLDPVKGGYKGAPKFPTFNLYETLLYFYNKTNNKK